MAATRSDQRLPPEVWAEVLEEHIRCPHDALQLGRSCVDAWVAYKMVKKRAYPRRWTRYDSVHVTWGTGGPGVLVAGRLNKANLCRVGVWNASAVDRCGHPPATLPYYLNPNKNLPYYLWKAWLMWEGAYSFGGRRHGTWKWFWPESTTVLLEATYCDGTIGSWALYTEGGHTIFDGDASDSLCGTPEPNAVFRLLQAHGRGSWIPVVISHWQYCDAVDAGGRICRGACPLFGGTEEESLRWGLFMGDAAVGGCMSKV